MLSVHRGLLFAGAVLALAVAVPVQPGAVQAGGKEGGGKGGEAVNIKTIDGVELHGMFYPSKPKAPVVIVLHALGDSAVNKKAYVSLAESLQPNYAVMLFDFRGHGKSKEINPVEFWKYPENKQGIKGASQKKTTIEYNELNKNYYPVLVNDIAAVKAYLDRRNDDKDCNTSSTILIGAETGATLGAVWLNSQWHLVRTIPNPANPFAPPQPSLVPEGKDVIACIWLSPTSKLGSGNVSLTKTLEKAVRENGCPTVFMYGDKDTSGKTVSEALVKNLTVKGEPKYKFIAPYPVKGGGKLTGINLIQKNLGTDTAVSDYLGDVVDKKANEWVKRDFPMRAYLWRQGAMMQAKTVPSLDPNNLIYDPYNKFVGR